MSNPSGAGPTFNKASSAEKNASRPTPVSQIELKKLESQRSKPAPALAPPTPLRQPNQASQAQSADREKRIKQIKDRLSDERDRARGAFDKSR